MIFGKKIPDILFIFDQKSHILLISGNLKTHIKRAHHLEMVQSMNLPKGAEDIDMGHAAHANQVINEAPEDNERDSMVNEEGIDLEGVVPDFFPQ